MKKPRLERADATSLRFTNLAPFFADSLLQIPDILALRDRPDIARRLFPAPSDDARINREWISLAEPELRRLFASAGEIMAGDLAGLELEARRSPAFRIVFPANHTNAWMSALNEARLILGEQYGVTEEDMTRPLRDLENPRELALARIWALGYLLELLVAGAEEPPPRASSGSD